MAETEKRRVKNKGVTITTIARKNKYNLYIEVSKDADISAPIKGNGYNFQLTFYDGRKTPGVPMSFERLNKPAKYAKKGTELTTSDYIIKNSEYRLVLLLEPRFYASKETFQEMEKRKEKAKAKRKNGKGEVSKGIRGFASSRNVTFYSHTNILKPYSGGGFSPR